MRADDREAKPGALGRVVKNGSRTAPAPTRPGRRRSPRSRPGRAPARRTPTSMRAGAVMASAAFFSRFQITWRIWLGSAGRGGCRRRGRATISTPSGSAQVPPESRTTCRRQRRHVGGGGGAGRGGRAKVRNSLTIAVQPIGFLDDDVEQPRIGGAGAALAGGWTLTMAPERIADLVRDARRHAAEIGQAFGARDLRLQRLAVRDIVGDALHAGDGRCCRAAGRWSASPRDAVPSAWVSRNSTERMTHPPASAPASPCPADRRDAPAPAAECPGAEQVERLVAEQRASAGFT